MTGKRTPEPKSADNASHPHGAQGPPCPIVGIGASAGGLEAFTELLEHLPADMGMAFVLIQHLDPHHESTLTQILSRSTALPVREVTGNRRVEANHVYVITPNTILGIADGVLKVQPRPQTRLPPRPVDTFFEALAQDQGERAIGVVLSGTANDGTLGLEAIKAENGITFTQDDSARYDSMPRSAVAAGCVDFVLAPEHIAQELARIAAHPYLGGPGAEDDAASATAHEDDQKPLPTGAEAERVGSKPEDDAYKKILRLLRNHSGVDFSFYKASTIQRRVTRRLVLSKETTLAGYARFLQGNAKELDALYSDVLISVTSFFRNPEAFDTLQREVLPALFQRSGDHTVRAWVLGCSTGQEAYSIAIAFMEAADSAPRLPRFQVFATDLNDALLEKARQGLYAKSLVQDITPERLRRFFVQEEGGYRVNKALREIVVFARQNLISDPPFSRMDLISCRNLLIYLDLSLQKKVLPTLHYALKPGGHLLLGASESIGGFTELFEPVDKKHKIYVKKAAPVTTPHLPLHKAHDERALRPPPGRQGEATQSLHGELNAQREADRIVINRFAPPGVLINNELQILQFRGPTGRYLEPPSGKASFDVLKMARGNLMLSLRDAINQARKEDQAARRDNLRINHNGATRRVNVEVVPLKNLRERCFLILFEETDAAGERRRLPAREPAQAERLPRDEATRRIVELEAELTETRDYLQSMQEQYEAANEELQAANEETESANEELQSLNEELETSKEELESSNEELTTVNEEMANRNTELGRLNDDLTNLQNSINLAIVLLGRDLTVRRFNVRAEQQFKLSASDVGRPIGHIRHNLVLGPAAGEASQPELERLLDQVIAGVREQTREVRDTAGRWYSLRLRPYLTGDNKVDGAVLMLLDIDAFKRGEQAAAEARDYAENVLETVREPLLVLDPELRVESANRAFYRTFRVESGAALGRFIYELGNCQWDIPRLRELLEQILSQNATIEDYQVEHEFEAIGERIMWLNARRLQNPRRSTDRILLAIEDVTERKRMERRIAEQSQELSELNRRKDEFLAMLSHELRNPMAPIFNALHLIRQEGSESALQPLQRDVLGVIERQVQHLARLVDDLLEVSRVTTGRIRLRIERVDINAVIERAVERVRPIIDQHKQQLSVAPAEDAVWLDADPARLEQVLGNLLNNASKYSDDGGHLALSVERGSEEAIIRVRDDGEGMANHTLPHIFELFTQADPSLERSHSGLGIGLALVKTLVELHGGTVEARSDGFGQGSEFVVHLPLASAQTPPVDAAAPPDSAPGSDGHLRVLVVDDNVDAAKMASLLLRSWDYDVRVAHDGAGALQEAAEFRPQVILLDLGLPDTDGYEVARRVRDDPQLKTARIVAVTGYGQDTDRQRSQAAGFDHHLTKPVEPSALKALLAEFPPPE